MAEEDETFQQNGIIVEPKEDHTEDDRKGRKLKVYLKKYKDTWTPSNITEYLFYDQYGTLSVHED